MTVEQTVDIPASHRLIIEVPREIPAGRAILTVTPVPADLDIGIDGACPLDHTPNAETAAAIREGRAMMRGEIPAHWHYGLEDLDKILGI